MDFTTVQCINIFVAFPVFAVFSPPLSAKRDSASVSKWVLNNIIATVAVYYKRDFLYIQYHPNL